MESFVLTSRVAILKNALNVFVRISDRKKAFFKQPTCFVFFIPSFELILLSYMLVLFHGVLLDGFFARYFTYLFILLLPRTLKLRLLSSAFENPPTSFWDWKFSQLGFLFVAS